MTADEQRDFWEKGPPVIEGGALVRGGMFPHQRKWWGLPNHIRVLVGGYGSGKTHALCKWSIGMALHNAPAPQAIVSPTFPVARETTIRTLRELLDGKQTLYPSRLAWSYNKTEHVFTVRLGRREGRIIVYSGEHPERLKGPNLGGAGIDEPFIQDKEVLDQMMARVRDPQATAHAIAATGTPEQLNWGYDLIDGDLADQYDVGWVRAPTKANLALPDWYVRKLTSAYDDRTAKAYLLGEFVNLTTGLVYYGFSPDRNVRDIEAPESAEWGCGMDFNVDPMAFVVFWRDGDHLHVVADEELPNSDTPDALGVLAEKYPKVEDVYPDPSGAARKTSSPAGVTDFHWIREAGYRIHARRAHCRQRDRYNAVNAKLRPKGRPAELTISTKCRRLRKALLAYSHEKKNKPEQKALSHVLDATGYAVEYLYPVAKSMIVRGRIR